MGIFHSYVKLPEGTPIGFSKLATQAAFVLSPGGWASSALVRKDGWSWTPTFSCQPRMNKQTSGLVRWVGLHLTDSNWRRFKQSLFIRSCSNHFVGLFLLQHAPGAKFLMMLTAGSCILSAVYCLLCGRSQKLIIISFSMFISPEEFVCVVSTPAEIFEVILGQNSPNVFGMLYLTPCCIEKQPVVMSSQDPIPLLVVKSSEIQ